MAIQWTNPSVVGFARTEDPVEAIANKARSIALRAIEQGWAGPPFDPFKLADILRIPVEPRENLADARTVPSGSRKVRIEYNPNRPFARISFSVAHELAHTFFPDCAETVRNRKAGRLRSDDWQLELLCNVAAAELLMPVGTFAELADEPVNIERLMVLREQYRVSAEALLLRYAKLSKRQCATFAAARNSEDESDTRYRVDYLVPSKTWPGSIPAGILLPADSLLAECTAIGFTAKGNESWHTSLAELHVECVGIPPYPDREWPRVVGILSTKSKRERRRRLEFLFGDATQPRGGGYRMILQVVNDRTSTWGAGFARAVARKWPDAQADFQKWWMQSGQNRELGKVHAFEVQKGLAVVSMVAQHGYGPSKDARIRYEALTTCLSEVGSLALERQATVHTPRIGTGLAGGKWDVVEELIDNEVCGRGISVIVYTPPERVHERQESFLK